MFECYLDDSYTATGECLGIAGFLGHVDGWKAFEAEAEPFLKKWGVDVLRGKDFHNGHNSFKGWSGAKKADFVDALFSIAGKNLKRGINSVVHRPFFAKKKKMDPNFGNMSELGFAFSNTVTSIIYKNLINEPDIINPKLSFAVESGNSSNQNLVRFLYRLKSNLVKSPVQLGDIRFVDKRDCRAIQLADFLAFHGRKEADRWAANGWKIIDYKGHALCGIGNRIDIFHNRFFDSGTPTLPGLPTGKHTGFNPVFLPTGGLR